MKKHLPVVRVFNKKAKLLHLLLFFIFLASQVLAQETLVSGVVTSSADNAP
jgi:hypothetical protein